jgi:hypothetical protein
MRVSANSRGSVAATTACLVLAGDACPMVDRYAQATEAGLAHFNATGFAAPLCDWRHPGQGSQGAVISRLDGLMGLREQRGEDDPSHPRQGAQDCRVALLGLLPRFDLRPGELLDQDVQVAPARPASAVANESISAAIDSRAKSIFCARAISSSQSSGPSKPSTDRIGAPPPGAAGHGGSSQADDRSGSVGPVVTRSVTRP